jgi:nicotinate dehydrogenase subunit B
VNERIDTPPGLEPERYELDEGMPYHFDLRRRDFFKSIGAGIVVLGLVGPLEAQESGGGRRQGGRRGAAPDLAAWIRIDEDGIVTAFTGKVEIGQNIRTSLTQVIAEELHAPLDSIKLVMADTKLVPFDAGTFGSRTTPDMAKQLRVVAATAREMLLDIAAERFQIPREKLSVADGKVRDETGQKTLTFGALAAGLNLTKVISNDVPLRPPSTWTIAGTSISKVDGRAMVTGRHRYASDITVPGMLHGKILRPPQLGASLISADTTAAAAMPGVIVAKDGDFVGLAAPTVYQAGQALRTIQAEWKPPAEPVSQKDLFQRFKQTAETSNGRGGQRSGSIPDGLAAGEIKLEQNYTVAYIAHFPLEPRAAVAQWEEGRLTVWTGTQRPFGVREELMQAFKLAANDVRVIVPDMGSGYGGKHTGEAAVEAARLAKAAGKPVKLAWTREEEFAWAYLRPAGLIEVKSAAKKDGTLTAWEFHNYNSGGSAIRTLYEVPNQLIEFHPARSPLRQGSYRGLAATANHFARESHMDELARATGIDPLDFRLKNLKEERLRAVFEAAAKAFPWGKRERAEGHGIGIAGGSEKGSYVATCAEVRVDKSSGTVKVIRAVTAFECGAVLNPDDLKNQIEGSMIMGLGGALFEAIEFDQGKILNGRASAYRVPRFSDTPEIEVVLVNRLDLPSVGAGETPIVAIAPAIGNAIFDAVGVRLRSLPMASDGVKV